MKELKRYVATYEYRGKIQGVTFKASDEHDAKRRVKSIRRNNLRFQGDQTEKRPEKFPPSDFVWFGRMIERFSKLHEKVETYFKMQNCSAPTCYTMSGKTGERFIKIATAYPDLVPMKLLHLPVIPQPMEDETIGYLK